MHRRDGARQQHNLPRQRPRSVCVYVSFVVFAVNDGIWQWVNLLQVHR